MYLTHSLSAPPSVWKLRSEYVEVFFGVFFSIYFCLPAEEDEQPLSKSHRLNIQVSTGKQCWPAFPHNQLIRKNRTASNWMIEGEGELDNKLGLSLLLVQSIWWINWFHGCHWTSLWVQLTGFITRNSRNDDDNHVGWSMGCWED